MVWINMNFFMFLFAIGSFKSLENLKINFHLEKDKDSIEKDSQEKDSILENLIPDKTNFYSTKNI